MRARSHPEVLSHFHRVGSIAFAELVNAQNRAVLWPSVPRDALQPGVYAWVEQPPNGELRIIYIGKAGNGLHVRHGQHVRGFLGTGRGSFHNKHISDMLRNGSKVLIYAYYPEPVEVLGEMVPSQSVAEEMLLASIEPKPMLNREAKRGRAD